MLSKSPYLYAVKQSVTKSDRRKLNNHKSCVIWLTGLSGSGKSTIASLLDRELYNRSIRSYVIDGDILRQGLTSDLGFSDQDRKENMRRVGEVARLFVDAGIMVIVALISPFREERNQLKELFAEDEFIEVFVDCPLSECERRDPKGLYKKARQGLIPQFTGISSPYEPPDSPDLIIDTLRYTPEMSVSVVMDHLQARRILTSDDVIRS